MRDIKGDNGITLTVLVVMIIVIMILAGVSIIQGSNLMRNTKIETYVTNMITIKSKIKVYAEEVNAETWDIEDKSSKRAEIYWEKYKMKRPEEEEEIISKANLSTESSYECYEITKDTLVEMNLDDLAKDTNSGNYAVIYDSNDYKNLEIIYIPGIEYNNTKYYTLSSLQQAINE